MAGENQTKRLIACCDGTWSDSDNGYLPSSLVPYYPEARVQVPTNVTRISKALRNTGLDGKMQIVYYHSGVGTGSNIVDAVAGGLFGVGISETIRAAYSFITTNYTPGDEIILIGFSRGAFTARSVAGMIRAVGLLTRRGMNDFYPIYTDQKNFTNPTYHDVYPNLPFPNKPMGRYAAIEYKRKLWKENFTRINDPDGSPICVKAIAVWDTVGSLGIPRFTPMARLGLPSYPKEYWFYDTTLESNTKHAFQALALDERRAPFTPAVWERRGDQTSIDLRQVWFPGAHKNVGGGYDDQGTANIALAWMMDQLASIGVGFQDEYIDQLFQENIQYYRNPPQTAHLTRKQWAIKAVYDQNRPVRPFGLGKLYESYRGLYLLTGKAIRTPGLCKRINPKTGQPTKVAMTDTNERIHSSVRMRLQLKGLGPDDHGLYKAATLTRHGRWKLCQKEIQVNDSIPVDATWGPAEPEPVDIPDNHLRWVWEYNGPEKNAPAVKTMVEENLGPYQRRLLRLSHREGSTV